MNLFDRRFRGFRLVDVAAVALLIALILGVYLAKTMAGRERAEIAAVERKIAAEKARIRLLEAENAHLDQPGRVARLSTDYLGMAPVDPKKEMTPEEIAALAQQPKATTP